MTNFTSAHPLGYRSRLRPLKTGTSTYAASAPPANQGSTKPTLKPPKSPYEVEIKPAGTEPPTKDGEIRLYKFTDDKDVDDPKNLQGMYSDNIVYPGNIDEAIKLFDDSRRVIFVNGMNNNGTHHRDSAWFLSYIQLCPVIGVFNKTDGGLKDFGQCLTDKLTIQGTAPIPGSPKIVFDAILKIEELISGKPLDRAEAMTRYLASNPATVALFKLLRSPAAKDVPIYAHSQGNIILSNALQAVEIVDGSKAIQGREVHSYGSPTIIWPGGLNHTNNAFTFDIIGMIDLIFRWDISKVGLPEAAPAMWPWAHNFCVYLLDDAAFAINKHRVGGWSLTLSMDEEGLAQDLVKMGLNEPRVTKIFKRLDDKHNSDSDDVARYYINAMKKSTTGDTVLKTMKSTLVPLLKKILSEGYTSDADQDCINYLNSL